MQHQVDVWFRLLYHALLSDQCFAAELNHSLTASWKEGGLMKVELWLLQFGPIIVNFELGACVLAVTPFGSAVSASVCSLASVISRAGLVTASSWPRFGKGSRAHGARGTLLCVMRTFCLMKC